MVKRIAFLIHILVLGAFISSAQDIPLGGIIVEQNSKYRTGKTTYINGANVRSGATSTTSDRNGSFHITFSDKTIGERIRLIARKSGMEVVNKKELQKVILGQLDDFKIVMADAGKLAEAQVAYMEIAEDAIYREYDRKIALLKKEGKEREAFIAEMEKRSSKEILGLQDAKNMLEEQLEKALALAETYTKEIAAVNLDDASERYIRAYEAFERGQMDSVLQILSIEQAREDLKDLEEERRRIQNLEGELIKRKATLFEKEKDIIESNLLAAKTAIFEGQYVKGQEYYELAVAADSSDFDNLNTLCKFLSKQSQSLKLIHYAKMMIPLAKTPEEIVTAQTYLGSGLMEQYQEEDAAKAFEIATSTLEELVKQDREKFEPLIAKTLNSLGNAYDGLFKGQEAMEAYQKAFKINKQLSRKDPQQFQAELAGSFLNLGKIHSNLENYEEAFAAYDSAQQIYQKLALHNPDEFEDELADIFNNIGATHVTLQQFEEAKAYLEKSLAIKRKLMAKNPQRYGLEVAGTLNNLGNVYSYQKLEMESAGPYDESIAIYRGLVKENPERFKPKLAMIQYKMGNFLHHFERFEEAITAWKEALIIFKEMKIDNPRRFAPYFVTTIANLGIANFNLENYAEALEYEKEHNEARKGYYEKSPEGRYAPINYASSLTTLAYYSLYLQQFKEAEAYAQKAYEIDPKSQAAISNLAIAFLFQGKEDEAFDLYKKWRNKEWKKEAWEENLPYETFKDVFVKDLNELEEAGISHPLVQQARKLLEE